MLQMDGISSCKKHRHSRGDRVSCFFFVAILWMAATATPTAAAAAAEGDDEAAAAAAAAAVEEDYDAAAAAAEEWPTIEKRTTVQIGHWGRPRGTESPRESTTWGTTEVWATHSPSHLPPCHPHRVRPHGWVGTRNTYIEVTDSGCSLMVGDPTTIASETNDVPNLRTHLHMLRVYDGRYPVLTRQHLRAVKRQSCTASVSLLLPPLHKASGDDRSPSQPPLPPPPETHPSSAHLTDASGRGGHRRRHNRTRLGSGRRIIVRSFRVRNITQPSFDVWTSAAVRIDLHGACEPAAGVRGSLRLSVNYHPHTLSICEERHEAAMTRHPLPTGVLFAHERRFGFLLPEQLRCRRRLDYAAHVRAHRIIVSSTPDPASCRRLCVADRCGAQLRGLRLDGEPEDGGWIHVRYESTTRSSAAHRATGAAASAAADLSPEENSEEDDDDRHHDSGNEDPDSDDVIDAIGNSDLAASGNATQAAASRCRTDVYSGFVLLLSPGGHAYLLP